MDLLQSSSQSLSCEFLIILETIEKVLTLASLYMPDSPVDAKFLSPSDKLLAVERLRANQMGVVSTEWKWDHVKESLLDIKTYLWFALIFSVSCATLPKITLPKHTH